MSIFLGEMMHCALCAAEQRSHPTIESGWLVMVAQETDDSNKYCCPDCAGFASPKCPECQRFYHENYGSNVPGALRDCEPEHGGLRND